MASKVKAHVCNRGHIFYKSSDVPVCPVCWTGYYQEKNGAVFPKTLSAPALRALLTVGVTNLIELSKHPETEILRLHGMGPKAMKTLRNALKEHGLSFKK